MLINKEKTAESGCGGRSREDTKKNTKKIQKDERKMKKMWRSSLDRWIVSALQRFSVGFASVLACVRDCVPFVSGAVNKCPLYAHGLNGHMDTWTSTWPSTSTFAITHHHVMARLDNCAALERKVFFVSVSVRFGLVSFGFGFSDTTHACASVEYLLDLHCTIPYHTIQYHTIA